jgi:hypothetical protein
MYNRYIPQSDGSYRKKKIPEPTLQEAPNQHLMKPLSKPCPIPPPIPEQCPPPKALDRHHHNKKPMHHCKQDGITDFFKQLLPKDLDTADLLIIILLLLMSGDCEKDRNNALLTLALYFFM